MTRVVARRLLTAIPLMIAVSFFVFLLVDLVPGDPAASLAGETGTPELRAEIRKQLGLDDPLFSRYGHWLGHAAHLDFGSSYVLRRPVMDLIQSRIGVTVSLLAVTLVWTLLLSTILGIV